MVLSSAFPAFSCRKAVCLLVVFCSLIAVPAFSRTINITPAQSIRSAVLNMQPGDTLVLAPGDYYDSLTVLYITNKNGSPDAWYTIRAAEPGTARIFGNSDKNLCEIRNSSYWRFEGLELSGRNLSSDGIRVTVAGGNAATSYGHHIVVDNCNLHSFNNACINTQVTVWDLTVRNSWMHDANLAGYLGSPGHDQQIINLVWEHNLITRMSGYGMQIKAQNPRAGLTLGTTPGLEFDSWGWRVSHNVFHRDATTAVTSRPNLLVDAAPATGVGSDDLATIEGNVVLGNVYDSPFQLSGNLRVVNNVILNAVSATAGIRIGFHDITYPRHVEVLNNTVFIDGSTANACLSVHDLLGGYTQIIANNAFIRGNTWDQAVSFGSMPAGAVVAGNVRRGSGPGAGFTATTVPLSEIFANPVYTPGMVDLYPAAGSLLIDAGTNAYAPTRDFNGVKRPRGAAVDVGAYETFGAGNPGWQLDVAFKQTTGDTNGDHAVNAVDLLAMAHSWNQSAGDAGYNVNCDYNADGRVDVLDLLVLAATFGN